MPNVTAEVCQLRDCAMRAIGERGETELPILVRGSRKVREYVILSAVDQLTTRSDIGAARSGVHGPPRELGWSAPASMRAKRAVHEPQW